MGASIRRIHQEYQTNDPVRNDVKYNFGNILDTLKILCDKGAFHRFRTIYSN